MDKPSTIQVPKSCPPNCRAGGGCGTGCMALTIKEGAMTNESPTNKKETAISQTEFDKELQKLIEERNNI